MAVREIKEGIVRHYACDSTDHKPTDNITLHSLLWEYDTGKQYRWDGTNWEVTNFYKLDYHASIKSLLKDILVELRKMNLHFSTINEEIIKNDELTDEEDS